MTQEEKWRDLQREIRSHGIKNIRIMAENELYSSIEKERYRLRLREADMKQYVVLPLHE